MVHVRRCFSKTPSAEFDPLLFIKLVTYSDMERAGNAPWVIPGRPALRME